MSVRSKLAGVAAIATLAIAGSGTTYAQAPSGSPSAPAASPGASPVDLSDYSGLPQHATLRDGSAFTLNKATAKRLTQRKPLTVYLSIPASDPRFDAALSAGFTFGVDKASQAFRALKGRSSTPPDIASQAADITAQADSGKVDCMVVLPWRDAGVADAVNHALTGGVPVVSIGSAAGGNELAEPVGFGTSEGGVMGDQLVGWMSGATGHPLKTFAIAAADPTDPIVATRATDFMAQIAAGVANGYVSAPGPAFVTSATEPLAVGTDADAADAAYATFLTAHPEVDLIAVMDGPADQADKAIADANLSGKVHTVGFGLDSAQLDAIDAGIQIVIVQPDWYGEAIQGAVSCGQLLAGDGVADTGLPPITYGSADTARGRSDLMAKPGQ